MSELKDEKKAKEISELASFFGWTHVKNDNMRKSKKTVWLFYVEKGSRIVLRGTMSEIIPHSGGKRFVSFDRFDPFLSMQDALIVVSEMRKKGWRFLSDDIGHPKPLAVDVKFCKNALMSMDSKPISRHAEAISLAALEAARYVRKNHRLAKGSDR